MPRAAAIFWSDTSRLTRSLCQQRLRLLDLGRRSTGSGGSQNPLQDLVPTPRALADRQAAPRRIEVQNLFHASHGTAGLRVAGIRLRGMPVGIQGRQVFLSGEPRIAKSLPDARVRGEVAGQCRVRFLDLFRRADGLHRHPQPVCRWRDRLRAAR